MSEDEGRVAAARLDEDEVEAHGRIAQNEEPKDEAEEDEVEAHGRVAAPKLDAPKLD